MSADRLYSVKEVSEILGVSIKTLHRWEDRNIIKPQRTEGNQRRYTQADIDLLKQKTKKAKSSIIEPVIPSYLDITSIKASPSELTPFSSPVHSDQPGTTPPTPASIVTKEGVSTPSSPNTQYRFKTALLLGGLAVVSLAGLAVASLNLYPKFMDAKTEIITPNTLTPEVLAESVKLEGFEGEIAFNIPAIFNQNLTVNADALVDGNATVSGTLTAPNIVYSVIGGQNISITGDPQNPIISTGPLVSSFGGQTGDLQLAAGSGIGVDGLTINNTGVLSLSAGSGIALSGSTGTVTISSDITGVTSITGTTNQVNVSSSTGAVTLSLPQDIHLSAAPTFSMLNLTADTNQLVLGNGETATITMDTLTASRTYSFPNNSGSICIVEAGNCGGSGGGVVTAGGTINRMAKFTAAATIGDSSINDLATALAVTIDASGNVGIGTPSPTAPLDILDSTDDDRSFTVRTTSDTVQPIIRIANDATSPIADNDPAINFMRSNSTQFSMGIDVDDSNKFKIARSGSIHSSTALTIDRTSGNIGLGTAAGAISPLSRLVIAGSTADSSASSLNVQDSAGTSLLFVRNDGNISIGGDATPDNLFSVGSSSQFQVNSTGDIVKIKNLPYSWPSAHTANGFLNNDGSGNLTWTSIAGAGGVSGTGTANRVAFWNTSTNITSDDDFFFDGTSVGIGGDTTPDSLFSVGATSQFQVSTSGNIIFNQTSPTVTIGNTGSLTINDGTNTLCTLADAGTTGNFTCTGQITGSNLSGTNTGDVTLSGQNYLSIAGQVITANPVNLSNTNVTGTLAAARFGALTGDVTSGGGTYATTITNDAVTFAKIQNISTDTLLGRDTAGSGDVEELSVSGGLEFTGTGGIQTSAFTGDVAKAAGGTTLTIQDNSVDGTDIALGSDAQGDLMYYNGTDWVSLAGGTANQILHSGATPSWGDVALGTETSGNYLATLTGGNGITTSGAASGEGVAHALSLSALTANWDQTGAFDITLNNAASELRMLESAGGTFFGTLDVGDLTADRTFILPDSTATTDTICLVTLGNCAGSGSGVTTAGGTSGRLARFNGAQSLDNGSINDLNTGVAMTIDASGNVGVGTTNPAALFSVGASSQFQVDSTGAVTAVTLDTGQGANELYDMDQNVLTTSTVSFDTLNLTNDLTVANGGTGASTFTQGGILYGNAAAAIGASAQGLAGQVVLSGGAGAPTFTTGTLALSGNFSTTGANTLTLATTGATSLTLPTSGTLCSDTNNCNYQTAGSYEAPLTFSNGLTRTVNAVTLGGALTGNTDIPLSGFNFTLSGSGNVGIGTTTPGTLLEVTRSSAASQVRITRDSGSNATANAVQGRLQFGARYNGVINEIAQINGVYGGDGTTRTGYITFDTFNGSDTPQERMRIDNSGNVGIGDASPSSRLEVGDGTDSLQISSVGDLTFVDADGGASITGPAGGALAISSANSQDLTLTASDDLIFDDAQLTTGLNLSVADNAINGALTQGIVDAINDLYDLGTGGGGASIWSRTSGVIHPTTATDDLTIGGSTLAASMFGIDESAGNFYFGYDNSASPTLNFEATDGDAGEFGFNTNDAFYFSNANVGIGITNPDTNAGLHVLTSSGQIRAQSSQVASGWYSFYNSTADRQGYIQANDGSGNFVFSSDQGNDFVFSNANVGIGTTAPLGKLHLANAAATQFFMEQTDAAVDNKLWDIQATGAQLQYRVVNDANSAASQYMLVNRSGTTVTNVNFPNGNVGIGGDTTPDSLFSVGSTSQFQVNSSGAIAALTGFTQGSGVFSSTLTTTNAATFGSTTSGSDLLALLPQSTTTTNAFTGTITSVDLTAARQWAFPNTGGAICIVEAGNCAGSGSGVTTPGGTTDRLAKFTGAQSIGDSGIADTSDAVAITIDSLENVGIGDTSPLYLLTVGNGDLFGVNSSGNIVWEGATADAFELTLAPGNVGQDSTVTIPDPVGATDTVCLLTLANCVGTGGGVDGTGVTNRVAYWLDSNTIQADNDFFFDGTNVGIGTTLPGVKLDVIGEQAITVDSGTAFTVAKFGGLPQFIVDTSNEFTYWTSLASDGGTTMRNSPTLQLQGSNFNGSSNTYLNFDIQTIVTGTGANDYRLAIQNTGETELFSILASGNVGIGDTSPLYQLTVGNGDLFGVDSSGNIVWEGSTADAFELTLAPGNVGQDSTVTIPDPVGATDTVCLLTLANCTGTGGGVAGTGTANRVAYWTAANTIAADNDFFFDGSAVGIGTTTPNAAARLHISGGNLFLDQDSGAVIRFYGDSVERATIRTPDTASDLLFETNGSEKLRILANGNVGIGTTAPASILHLHSTSVTTDRRIILSDGTSGATTTDGFQLIKDTGQIGYLWNYETAGITFGTSNIARMHMSSAGGLSFGSAYYATNPGANNAIFEGNVGIGTTNPGAKLDVVGSGIFGNNGAGSYGVLISNNDQSNVRLRLTNTGSGGQSFSLVGGNPGLSNAGLAVYDETNTATRLYIDSTGNVGIGTTNPTSLLTLGSSVANSDTLAFTPNATGSNSFKATISSADLTVGNQQFNLPNLGAATTDTFCLLTLANCVGAGGAVDGTGVANRVAFWTDANTISQDDDFFFDGTNVGIGTTSTASKLDVGGTLTISDITNGKVASIIPNISVNGSLRTLRFNNATSAGTEGFQFYNSDSNTSLMMIQQNGNVGIGITNPSYKLDVVGGVGIGARIGKLAITDDSPFITGANLSSGSNGLALGSTGAAGVYIFTNNTEKMRLSAAGGLSLGNSYVGTDPGAGSMIISGNVGIGTASPTSNYKLDVAGNVLATGLNLGGNILSGAYVAQNPWTGSGNLSSTNAIGQSFNRLLGATTGRYTVSYTNFTGAPQLFDGIYDSAGVSISAGVSGITEVDFNPQLGWTANASNGFVYNSGYLVLSYYFTSIPTNISVDVYKPVAGTDQWVNIYTTAANTQAVVMVPTDAAANYVKKIRITSSNASIAVEPTEIEWFSTRENDARQMANIPRYSYTDVDLGISALNFKNSSYSTVSQITNTGSAYFGVGGGNVGIGVTNPGAKLDVAGEIRISNNGSGLNFSAGPGQYYAAASNAQHIFYGGGSEYARFDTAGNFGIGTTGPAQKLHVYGSTTPALRVQDSTNNVMADLFADDSNAYVGSGSNHPLAIITNSATRMYFDTSGNVGIGTTNPGSKLEINGSSEAAGELGTLALESSATSTKRFFAGFSDTYNAGYIQSVNSGVEWLPTIINPISGNVGIGATSPGTKLDVNGTFRTNSTVTLTGIGTGGTGDALCRDGSNNIVTCTVGSGGVSGSGTANYIPKFTTASNIGNSVMYDDGTNIGIGTTTPGNYKLNVNGALRAISTYTSYTGDGLFGATALPSVIATPGGHETRIGYLDDGAGSYVPRIGFYQTTGGNVIGANNSLGNQLNGDFSINVGTANQERIRIQAGGNVGIGTTAPGVSLTVAGTGLHVTGSGAAPTAGSGLEISGGTAPYIQAYNRTGSAFVPLRNIASHFTFEPGGTERVRIDASGNVGIGTTNAQSALDLGVGTAGRSLVWAGSDGSTHYASIGTSYSSADLNTLSGLKLSTSADTTLYSYTGTYGPSGMRLDYSAGDIMFFNEAAGAKTAGNNFDYAANTKLIIKSSGNVGIGTTGPNAKLEVATTYSSATAGEQYGQLINTTYGIADSGLKQGLRLNTTSSTTGTLDNLVGVLSLLTGSGSGGTTTAASSLWSRVDVGAGHTVSSAYGLNIQDGAGSGTIGNQYGVFINSLVKGSTNYALYTAGATQSYFGGNVGIGDLTPASALTVGDGDLFQVNSSGDIVKIKNLTYSWPASHTTNGFLKNDGSGTLTWTTIAGAGGVTGTGVANRVAYWDTTTNITADDDLFFDGASVGIGTTNPASFKLQIAGNVGPNANDTYDLGSDSLRWNDLYLGGNTLHLGTSTTDEATFGYNTATNILNFGTDSTTNGDIAFFTDDLYLDKSTGNVGIGTTGPTSLLTVNQSSNTTDGTPNSYGITLSNQGTVNMSLGSDASYAYLQSWASKPLKINSQGNNTLLNPTSGNVGIGTTGPSAKLQVAGDLDIGSTAASGNIYGTFSLKSNAVSNGGVWIEANGNTNALNINHNGSIGIITTDYTGTGSFLPLALQTNGGTVGIGTTGPGAQLDVRGSTGSGVTALRVVSDVNADDFVFKFEGAIDSTTNVMAMTQPGNVGIGLTNPSEQLEITGNLELPVTTASTGIIKLAGGTRYIHNYGTNNFFAGTNAGNLTQTGSQNTAVGVISGGALTTGTYNTFLGYNSGSSVADGYYNTLLGGQAGQGVTSGVENVMVGLNAGVTGNKSYSTILGSQAGGGGTNTGDWNVMVGRTSGFTNTSGTQNVFLGGNSAYSNLSGSYNAAIGQSALQSNSTGNFNVALGISAGYTLTAGNANTTGSSNSFIGAYSGPASATQLSNASAIGAYAVVGANNSLVLGCISGINSCPATPNVGIGTTAPSQLLHVLGSSGSDVQTYIQAGSANDNAVLSLQGGRRWNLEARDSDTWSSAFAVRDTNAGADRLLIDFNGNVGIGTTTPGSKLTVAGGDLTVDRNSVANTGNIYLKNSTTYSSDSRTASISVPAGLSGRIINRNADMLDGTTGYAVYDNSAGGKTTISSVASSAAPNSSGSVLRVSYDGTGTPNSNPTPGYGGFYVALNRCSGTNNAVNGYCYREGNRYIHRIWAKIPSGRTLTFASNSYGTGASHLATNSWAGTGNWESYEAVQTIGTGGTFSSTGFWYVDGGTNAAFTWDVAYVAMTGVDEGPSVLATSNLNVGYYQGANLGFGEFLTTQNTYLAASGGNVGIGTTAPLAQLNINQATDVQATLRLSNNGTSGRQINIKSPAAGFNGSIEQSATSADFIIGNVGDGALGALKFQTFNADRLTILNTGNVGIGTTSPGAPLEVSHSSTGDIAIFSTAGGTDRFKISADTNDSNLLGQGGNNLKLGTSASGTSITILNSTGNVGIGVTNPGVKLDIAGSAQISQGNFLRFPHASESDGNDGKIGAGLFATGLNIVGSKTDATYRKLSIWGEITQQQNGGTNSWMGNSTFSGSIGIGSTGAPSTQLHVTGGARITGLASCNTIDTDSNGVLACGADDGGSASGWTDDGTVVRLITGTDSVGIGTTAPGARLQIGAHANSMPASTGLAIVDQSLRFIYTDGNADYGSYLIRGYDSGSLMTLGTRDGGTDTNALTVKGGNVGIGTTAPETKLHIASGNLLLSNNQQILFENSGGTNVRTFDLDSGNNLNIGRDDNVGNIQVFGIVDLYDDAATPAKNISFDPATNGNSYFNTGGNVGIGTTAPTTYKLHVVGNTGLYGTNMDGNVGGSALDINGAYISIGDLATAQTLTNGVGIKFYDAGVAHSNLRYVASSDRMDFCGSSANATINCSVTPTLSLLSMNAAAGGNVGIGTTTPDAKLEVKGSTLNSDASGAVNYYRNVAHAYLGASTQTGTLKIALPTSWTDTMLSITIKGYDYSTKGAWEVVVGGYNYSGGPQWINTSAEIRGKAPFTSVRLAHDGTKNVILLGTTATTWEYASVEVTDVAAGYNAKTGWGSGWAISLITSETGITNINTPVAPMTIASNGDISTATDLTVGGGDISLTGTSTITGGGSQTTYGALSVNGSKNGWGGINFRNGATNYGTFMLTEDYSGVYNNSDNGWDWYFTNGTLSAGTIPAANVAAGSFGAGNFAFTGYASATSDFRAPIFYDTDNTGYYTDPAGTSNLNALTMVGALNVTAGQANFTFDTAATDYTNAQIELLSGGTGKPARISFHVPGVVASQLGMGNDGILRTFNNPGTAYEQFAASAFNVGTTQVIDTSRNLVNIGSITGTGYFSITGVADGSGNLRFSAANPYIYASSYIVIPGGAHFSSGTVYTEAQLQARGGIADDGGVLEINDDINMGGGDLYVENSAGEVGVGTTSPAARFHSAYLPGNTDDPAGLFEVANCGAPCAQPAWTEAMRLLNSNANGRAGIGFLTNASSTLATVPDVWLGKWDGSSTDLAVAANVSGTLTERFRIQGATGEVGIGVTDPGYLLEVNGTARVNGALTIGDASGDTVTANAASWTFANDTDFSLSGGVNGLSFGTDSLSIDATNDRIGIGTTGPATKIHTKENNGSGFAGITLENDNTGGVINMIRVITDVGSTDNTVFKVLGNGDIYTDGSTTLGTPADVAEKYPVNDEGIEAGEILSATDEIIDAEKTDDGNVVSREKVSVLGRSTIPYDSRLIGIVSTNPGLILSGFTDGKPVALSGRVPVKIAADSETIKAGDYLTSSSTPGAAMKAGRAGVMIGKALEDWDPNSGKDRIMIFVSLGYMDPNSALASLSFDEAGNLILPETDEEIVTELGGTPAAEPKRDLGWTLGDFAKRIQKLEDKVASGSAGVSNTDDSTRLDALTDKLELVDSELSGLKTRTTSLEETVNLIATSSAGLNAASTSAQLDLETIDATDVTITNSLSVGGRATLSDVGITGKMNIGLLSVEGLSENGFATLNTTSGNLQIQSDGVNGVDFLAGKVVIEPNGDMKVEGTVTVKKLNVDTSEVAGASLGEGILEAGTTSIVIETTSVTSKSRIFITPRSKTSLPLSVTTQTAGDSFKVETNAPATGDIKFNWWIVN